MTDRAPDQTPRPPASPEFAPVAVGGPPHAYPATPPVSVTKLAVGPYENNVYVVASDGEAVLVDGAAEADRILALLEGLRVTAIVETHNHPDHTAALASLVEALGAPVLAHPADPMPVAAEPLAGGERLRVGTGEIEVLHTPGHTPGSLCFLTGGFLFSGDTLFPGGPGNTGGDDARFAQVMDSLDGLFDRLDDGTRVCPGHGLDTTIGRERPHVDTWRSRGW